MKKILSTVKKISSNYIPHFRSYKKIKLVKSLGDLCLIRSKLHNSIDELSEGIKIITDSYNSVIFTKNKEDIQNLILIDKDVKEIQNEVKILLNENIVLTSMVEKINNIKYLYDQDIEQSIINSKSRAQKCINEYYYISGKISRLNSVETP